MADSGPPSGQDCLTCAAGALMRGLSAGNAMAASTATFTAMMRFVVRGFPLP